jgi:hypothetical protein
LVVARRVRVGVLASEHLQARGDPSVVCALVVGAVSLLFLKGQRVLRVLWVALCLYVVVWFLLCMLCFASTLL